MPKTVAVFVLALLLVLPAMAQQVEVDGVTGASYTPPLPPQDRETLEAAIGDWLQSHWLMTLATVTPAGEPRAATVSYLREGLTVYFMARQDTDKVVNLRNDPRVSYTVWDPPTSIRQLKSLQVTGLGTILDGEERRRIAALMMFARGSSNARSFGLLSEEEIAAMAEQEDMAPNFAIVRVVPLRARWMDNTRGGVGSTDVIDFPQNAPPPPPPSPRPWWKLGGRD